DLDHFKQVNDRHGHEAGDEVLRQFVLLLNQQLRKSDLTGRIGGEEFAVLLRESTEAQAWSVAERVRTALQQMPIRHRDTIIEVTVSIGVAQSGADGESFAELFRTADQRLYQAKRSGRNRTLFRETADVATP
ncbi:MAG: GGDEF domain-containing protein, partial [Pseudomonadales bacterium]|nr:GGDEF domain-containing protein [Pseudomonadales bacterium]